MREIERKVFVGSRLARHPWARGQTFLYLFCALLIMPKSEVIDANAKDHGKCLGCGKDADLVDGYLCAECFEKEAPDFEET
jgi:hypothetical protein